MSTQRQRGYSSGYAAGCKQSDKALSKQRSIADRAAERAERAEKKQGIGHCEDCAFWAKGCDNCSWGYCGVGRSAGTPYGTWISGESANGNNDGRVLTSTRFGCVLFSLRKESLE